ncbi:unnamed protein product [Acanthosepion pharaonis]|uniref:Uncharacterized protein n=1 Tax=Acanthosepion pharaonis TaxID=158019 RepID=A0A812CVL2_ACAPH|nr:unnamed protein product [Sepia pharaonis]
MSAMTAAAAAKIVVSLLPFPPSPTLIILIPFPYRFPSVFSTVVCLFTLFPLCFHFLYLDSYPSSFILCLVFSFDTLFNFSILSFKLFYYFVLFSSTHSLHFSFYSIPSFSPSPAFINFLIIFISVILSLFFFSLLYLHFFFFHTLLFKSLLFLYHSIPVSLSPLTRITYISLSIATTTTFSINVSTLLSHLLSSLVGLSLFFSLLYINFLFYTRCHFFLFLKPHSIFISITTPRSFISCFPPSLPCVPLYLFTLSRSLTLFNHFFLFACSCFPVSLHADRHLPYFAFIVFSSSSLSLSPLFYLFIFFFLTSFFFLITAFSLSFFPT